MCCKRFGYYSTESNGHLSEYLPWYRKRTEEINQWIDLSSWINGETGGYLRVCTEGRNWFETEFPQLAGRSPAGTWKLIKRRPLRRARQRTSSRRWRPAGHTAGTST
jgi:alpha-galactosidase